MSVVITTILTDCQKQNGLKSIPKNYEVEQKKKNVRNKFPIV